MARVYLTNFEGMDVIYTVDQAVGTGCPNKRDDVLLVQFFLKVKSEGPQKSEFTPAGREPLKTDGVWGPASQAYLNHFLAVSLAKVKAFPLKQDGRVDPVVGGRFTGPKTGHVFTIIALNSAYGNVRGSAALKDITTDSVFPQELRPSLKANL